MITREQAEKALIVYEVAKAEYRRQYAATQPGSFCLQNMSYVAGEHYAGLDAMLKVLNEVPG